MGNWSARRSVSMLSTRPRAPATSWTAPAVVGTGIPRRLADADELPETTDGPRGRAEGIDHRVRRISNRSRTGSRAGRAPGIVGGRGREPGPGARPHQGGSRRAIRQPSRCVRRRAMSLESDGNRTRRSRPSTRPPAGPSECNMPRRCSAPRASPC